MNRLKATINAISVDDGIARIVGGFESEHSITAVTLEPPKNIKDGDSIFFIFKETEVGIAKNLTGEISFSNRFNGTLTSLLIGNALARASISIDGNMINSIITAEAAKRLSLKEGDVVTAFIKATEVSWEIESE